MERTVAFAKVEGEDVEGAVRHAVSLSGGLDRLISSTSRVLVKPNLWSPQRSGTGSITDASVTEAVTKLVLEYGARSVVIGDGCGAGYDGHAWSTDEAFVTSGLRDVANRLGVELRNLNSDAFEEVEIPDARVMDRVKIARTALESDVIISVPVLKSHIRTHVTLSLKNMKGVIAGAEKRKTHRLGLDQAIVDLNRVVCPHFVVLDATMGMQGLWSYPDDCVSIGLVGAGAHALSVDLAGAWLMGIDPNRVMHLRYRAQDEGLPVGLEGIPLVGEPVEAYRAKFKTGFEVFSERYPGVTILQGESACTGCTSELVTALKYLDISGYSPEMAGLHIVLGDVAEVSPAAKLAVLGRCAAAHAPLGVFAGGCPPSEETVIRALCEASHVDPAAVLYTRDRTRRELWDSTRESLEH
ncbi:MAG: DUF362 domain-containing protein [Dehalococcoidia bacterium]|nr:DUF362 domain-containing protein [Dehalococcoidia bacterium]